MCTYLLVGLLREPFPQKSQKKALKGGKAEHRSVCSASIEGCVSEGSGDSSVCSESRVNGGTGVSSVLH